MGDYRPVPSSRRSVSPSPICQERKKTRKKVRKKGKKSDKTHTIALRLSNKKRVATLAIWGEATPGAILTKCGMWADMVDVITFAVFGDCRLTGVGVVRGVNLPSPIDLRYRPYNAGHTAVLLVTK